MISVPYFDGDTPPDDLYTYSWTGVPHASASTRSLTTGIWVEPFTDAPVPRVGITVDGLDGVGPSVVTVWRSTVGGVRRKVRGWDARRIFGSDFAIDYEAPLGRVITYELQVISGAVVPQRLTATTTLDVTTGFIQDPLLPLGAIPVSGDRTPAGATLRSTAFQQLDYEAGFTSTQVLGSREPVVNGGQRRSASNISYDMITRAAQDATDLRNLLTVTSLILVRPLPEWGPLPDLIYTMAQVVSEMPYDVSYGGSLTRWALKGDTVRPPSIQVLVALWTYDQVAALWATYGDAQSAANLISATYLDAQRDPTMGV